jgi:hypothetical protein
LLAISAQRLLELSLTSFSWALVGPFVRPLGAAALEMAVVAAIPASVLAANASGLSLRGSLVWGVLATSFSIGASLACEPKGVAPGYVAQLLIDSGREACPGSAERRVRVPVVSVEWSCPEGQPPRARGTLPFGKGTRYSARSIEVSSDLRTISAGGLTLAMPAGKIPFGVHLAAERSRITGLPPWGRPSGPSAGERLTRAAVAAWASLFVGLFLLRRYPQPAWWATVAGLCAGVVPLLAQRLLDRQGGSLSLSWIIASTGAAAILLLLVAGEGVRRWLRRRAVVAQPGP